jgi:hypothetical protein
MAQQTDLEKTLQEWCVLRGDLGKELEAAVVYTVETPREARSVCVALELVGTEYMSSQLSPTEAFKPLFELLVLIQNANTDAAVRQFDQCGVPALVKLFDFSIHNPEVEAQYILFILKILAMYQYDGSVERIKQAAEAKIGLEENMWFVLFEQFDEAHPDSEKIIETMRHPLPPGFSGVAYLDLANHLAIYDDLDDHPFNTSDGHQRLSSWLMADDHFSFAHSAAASLPFISPNARSQLFKIAKAHPDDNVRLEAAWASAYLGEQWGLIALAEFAADPEHRKTAVEYLTELGKQDCIPSP